MSDWTAKYKTKLILPENLELFTEGLRKSGKRLVTINGSFDLMHAGHLHILFEAKKRGDVLLVALNSDRSIQTYKSPLRPIIPLEYRLQMVAAIEFVDFVTYFDETDPCKILEKVKPAVHVNGAEYGPRCLEADVVEAGGGFVYYVEKVPGLSTTQIIERITTCAS